ncbi:hypothetical protein ARMGADRAFT_1083897 [Armillaria gallica]|uniref:F-box domain-containing protein n=1 Tax=Armillaria gallica TaxID=47427 RepID=A0A2H3DD62_ARMGA|nr:hypothetical protein ARMGADRAFT_1083897 [Armillaria gallica]
MSAVWSTVTNFTTLAGVYVPPIDKVPVEILAKFFVAASEEHDFKVQVGKRSDATFVYRDVCRLWHQVISTACPQVWSKLEIMPSSMRGGSECDGWRAMVELVLNRSRKHDLHIFFTSTEEHEGRAGSIATFIHQLAIGPFHLPLLTLLRDRCPRLISFKVNITEPDSLHVLHMNACEFSDGLQHAVFTGLGAGTILRMPFDTLYDLTDVRDNVEPPVYRALLESLRSASELSSLNIQYDSDQEMSMTVDANTTTVFLPALTSFTTCNSFLLMALTLPVVEGVFIKCGLLRDTEEDGPLNRLCILPELLVLLQNSQCQLTLRDMELHDVVLTSDLTTVLQQALNLDTLMIEMTEWTATNNDVLTSLIGGLRIRSEEKDVEDTLLPSLSLLSISIEGATIPTSLSFIGEGLVETLESRIPKENLPNFTMCVWIIVCGDREISRMRTRVQIFTIDPCLFVPDARTALTTMFSIETTLITLASGSENPPENEPVACNDMARSPVAKIPAELIAKIARASKDATKEALKVGDATESLYTMAQVCRSWRDVVEEGCPEVWADFSVHIPPAGSTGGLFEFMAAEDTAISPHGATAFRYLLEEGYRWKSLVLNLGPQLLQMLGAQHFDSSIILSSLVSTLQTDTNRLDTLPMFAYAKNARSLLFTGLNSKTQLYLPSLNLVRFTDIRTQIRSLVHDALLISLQVTTRLSKVEMLYTHIMDVSPSLPPLVSWSSVTYFWATHRRTLGAVVLPSLQALVVEPGHISWSNLHGADLHIDTMPTICDLIDRSRCDVSLERVELFNVPLTNHIVAMAQVTPNLKSLQLTHVFWKKEYNDVFAGFLRLLWESQTSVSVGQLCHLHKLVELKVVIEDRERRSLTFVGEELVNTMEVRIPVRIETGPIFAFDIRVLTPKPPAPTVYRDLRRRLAVCRTRGSSLSMQIS